MKLALCIVGCGQFARTFVQSLQPMRDDLDLFFASRDPARARAYTALFHGRKTPIKSALLNQKLLRGVGNTRIPFYCALVANVVNAVLNYSLVLGNFGMPSLGVRGSAIGTVTDVLPATNAPAAPSS